jgi:hypothetical protein
MRADEEIARFCAEHGVTDSDLLIAQILVPFEMRPGETAKDAYERELRAMARNDDHGRKSQEHSIILQLRRRGASIERGGRGEWQ